MRVIKLNYVLVHTLNASQEIHFFRERGGGEGEMVKLVHEWLWNSVYVENHIASSTNIRTEIHLF